MISSTVENYLKAAYVMSHDQPESASIPLGGVAARLRVTPGTVTTMVKSLADKGYVSYQTRRGMRLTANGKRVAASVLRKHRLIELFLVEVLRLDDQDVHAEAEILEHSLSDLVVNRIDVLLGFPELDPHGSPIPGEDGVMRGQALRSLADCEIGTYRLCKVLSTDTAFLRWLSASGLGTGATVRVMSRDANRDVVEIASDAMDIPVSIGTLSAAKLMVR